MKKLKTVFNGLYFAYLFVSVLMFIFRQNIYEQSQDLTFLLRFLNFWILLGFFFLIAMWIIQTMHIRFLRKDIEDAEKELHEVKLKLYDIDQINTEKPIEQDTTPLEQDVSPN